MTATPSKTSEAMRDTLVHRAEGTALQTLSALYGLPKPDYASADDWRYALGAVALGPRGTPMASLSFLEGALGHLSQEFTVTVDPAQPVRITAAAATWEQTHVGRLVRLELDGALYQIVGPQDVSGAGGGYLELAPYRTAYFAGADFSTLSAATSTTATILGFRIEEPGPGPDSAEDVGEPALYKVIVYGEDIPVPPTYLQPDAGARPVGEPYGGHLQEDEIEDTSQITGPYPPYLVGVGAFDEIAEMLEVQLAAGVRAVFRRSLGPV